jgi:hypothetical protein
MARVRFFAIARRSAGSLAIRLRRRQSTTRDPMRAEKSICSPCLEVDVFPPDPQLVAEGPEGVGSGQGHGHQEGQEVDGSTPGESRHDSAGRQQGQDDEDVTEGLQQIQQHVQLQQQVHRVLSQRLHRSSLDNLENRSVILKRCVCLRTFPPGVFLAGICVTL